MHNTQSKNLTLSALFAAAIAVMTAYILHIPIPTGGYIHVGDALIYLAACVLPLPYAIGAAVIGAGLADLLTAPMWVLTTVIIKALVVLPFTAKSNKILSTRNLIACVISGLISPLGYAIAAVVMLGGWAAFVPQFLGTLVQGVGSALLFVVIATAMERANLRARLA